MIMNQPDPNVPGATPLRPGPAVPGATVTSIASKRGRKPGTVAKVRAELPAEEFVIEKIPEDDRGKHRRQRLERSKQQTAVDNRILAVYKLYKDSGSPKNWTDMPVQGWVLSKQFEDDALFMLRKAANYHGKKLVVGKIQYGLPDGKIRIPFCVIDRPKKAAKETPVTTPVGPHSDQ
jgi:hypothetical protein